MFETEGQLPIEKLPQFDVEVDLGYLEGPDGNAFAILGKVDRALREAGEDQETRDLYQEQATSGDYDHLLAVTEHMVIVA